MKTTTLERENLSPDVIKKLEELNIDINDCHIMKDYWNFNFSRQNGRILHGENEYRIWRDKIKGEWLWDNNQ